MGGGEGDVEEEAGQATLSRQGGEFFARVTGWHKVALPPHYALGQVRHEADKPQSNSPDTTRAREICHINYTLILQHFGHGL